MTTRLQSRRHFLHGAAALSVSAPMLGLGPQRSARAQGADVLKIGASPFINQAAIFLASEKASGFVTGIDLRVDGGFLAQTI